MIKLTADMKQMLQENLAYIATVDAHGYPDIGPKISVYALDDQHIGYYERTGKQHYQNLQANGILIIAVANKVTMRGYRFHGETELHTDDHIFQDAVQFAQTHDLKRPLTVPVLRITRIDTLDAGPRAGEVLVSED
ncbi:pyridoxamine 5'-phosphate oxidase family protein [Agrilactobacillus fermenti]|uniref:pyridoxamine 5'-phosphate oxidase family protein n=1 Tax=Agrilactobacillus fermenti TaxID=2586909 RepID=UPI003A5BAA07